jgi:hypothetical protein
VNVETGDAVERKSLGAILSTLAPQAMDYDQWRQTKPSDSTISNMEPEPVFEEDEYNRVDLETMARLLNKLSSGILSVIPSLAMGKLTDELERLLQHAEEIGEVPKVSSMLAVFIGRMAAEKYTLINAILGRKLCETGGGSAACTQVATSYNFLRDHDDTTPEIKAEVVCFTHA